MSVGLTVAIGRVGSGQLKVTHVQLCSSTVLHGELRSVAHNLVHIPPDATDGRGQDVVMETKRVSKSNVIIFSVDGIWKWNEIRHEGDYRRPSVVLSLRETKSRF